MYAKYESIFCFPTIYKANRNYTAMLGKSTHLAVIPQQSTQNTANLPFTDIREKPVNFFYNAARASTWALAIILTIQVPSQKFPFLFISTIPCSSVSYFRSCLLINILERQVQIHNIFSDNFCPIFYLYLSLTYLNSKNAKLGNLNLADSNLGKSNLDKSNLGNSNLDKSNLDNSNTYLNNTAQFHKSLMGTF